MLQEIAQATEQDTPRLVSLRDHEQAWEVGLACRTTIEVFVEPSIRHEVIAAATEESGSVVATVLDGGRSGDRS